MKSKRFLALILAMVMVAFVFSGCGKTTKTTSEDTNVEDYDYSKFLNEDGKTVVRVAIDSDPGTFDPAEFGSATALNSTATSLRESLYERDQDGNLVNQIAKDYTVDDDNLTYHIEIYDYVYDTDGNHITAEDVVFCFLRAKENGFNSTSYIENITADDDYNITLELNSTATGIFAQVVQVIQIYSQKAYEDADGDFGTNPVFTGAYKLTDWVIGTSLTLEVNEDYWQKDELRNIYAATNVDIIEFYIFKEASQFAIALETDQVDMVDNLSALEAERFMEGGDSSEGFSVFDFTNRQSQLMYLNVDTSSVFYDNLALREAVMYCMDIDGIIEGAANGYGVECKTFGNSMISDYQSAWDSEDYFGYDLDYAKERFAESGYAKGEVKLRIMTSNNEMRTAIAQIIQGYLSEVGIESEILTYEDALFNTYKYDPAEWDIMLEQSSWNGPTVTTWRDKFDSRTFENGLGGFIFSTDDKLQSLMEAALDVSTYSEDNVDAFHQYLKEQAYARGLFNQSSFSVTSDCVVEYMNHRIGVMFPAGCTYAWN